MTYTLDTNAVIYYAKGDARATHVLEAVFAEQTLKEEEQIERFLRALIILPLNSQIARIASAIRKQYATKTLDSAIAATALITNSSLLIRNIRFKHFYSSFGIYSATHLNGKPLTVRNN